MRCHHGAGCYGAEITRLRACRRGGPDAQSHMSTNFLVDMWEPVTEPTTGRILITTSLTGRSKQGRIKKCSRETIHHCISPYHPEKRHGRGEVNVSPQFVGKKNTKSRPVYSEKGHPDRGPNHMSLKRRRNNATPSPLVMPHPKHSCLGRRTSSLIKIEIISFLAWHHP
jgi:hypothetical protein